MAFIDEVREDHQDLARALRKHKGIRRMVEDLYPDTAHFIYELLQNAEDTGAKQACFYLDREKLVFEHDGRPFSEADIWAITDIGEGTKSSDEDKIGRFGIGFKAVFAYSETPNIWSPSFSFRISDLVLPTEIPTLHGLGNRTRFEFPFNNPKKPAETARSEVRFGLEQLAETTLLFLTNIESIRWQDEKRNWEILRVHHSENHIEILKQSNGNTEASSHFLRFSETVKGLDMQNVSVAYELAFLKDGDSFNPRKRLSSQLRIVQAQPGKVAVFFPAEKESSGLRFHLHAPFVPELSRSSIKDSPANIPLYQQLAELTANSLHKIRDLNLLTVDFLAVLPNPQDTLSGAYEPIRSAVVSEMNDEKLTPTHSRSHAPAKTLLQGKASLKDLLCEEDIQFLVDGRLGRRQWAISASQRNSNADRFLVGLAIKRWDYEEFVETLKLYFSRSLRWVPDRGWLDKADETAIEWLKKKPLEWHQQFYSSIHREFDRKYHLMNLQIVRVSDGSYLLGKECYFPEPDVKRDDVLPRVDLRVFTSGRSKSQQSDAKSLLLEIGVREVNESDRIQAILDQRYTHDAEIPSDSTYLRDLRGFCRFVKKNPTESKIFNGYYLFKSADDKWRTPAGLFLDSPLLDTNLTMYFESIGDESDRVSMSPWYVDCGLKTEDIVNFARSVGVIAELEIIEVRCTRNPDWNYLRSVPGERLTSPINRDYTIHGLPEILKNPTLTISHLLWQTIRSVSKKRPDVLRAIYRKNESNGSRHADSQLVHILRDAAWVPQDEGTFVRPAEADNTKLPNGFPFDAGETWLDKLNFGELLSRKREEKERLNNLAIELGFEDNSALNRAKRFASIPLSDQEAFLFEFEKRQSLEFPQHSPRSPERRNRHVGIEAANAPKRIVEKRSRSVSIGRDGVKAEAVEYLKELYSSDGEMFCQICQAPMPFKLENGNPFFETVEFLRGLDARHYQNYLALCPNHSAMFMYANSCEDEIRPTFLSIDESHQIDVVLAGSIVKIRFTETHVRDLKTVIEMDDLD